MARVSKYSPEMQSVRFGWVLERRSEHESQWAVIVSIAAKIGGTADAAALGAAEGAR